MKRCSLLRLYQNNEHRQLLFTSSFHFVLKFLQNLSHDFQEEEICYICHNQN